MVGDRVSDLRDAAYVLSIHKREERGMSNRRFEMYEYHQALVRMRLGESDRQIAKTGLMGRRKLALVRETAESQGWLEQAASLPSDAALALYFSGRATKQPSTSSIIPFQDDVRNWVKQSIAGCTIHQALIRKHGFTGAYSSARRFIAKIKRKRSIRPFLRRLSFLSWLQS